MSALRNGNGDNVFKLRPVHRKHKRTFKAQSPHMLVLAELPCGTYPRYIADNLAFQERKQHILPVYCSRVVLASGVAVWRVFMYVGNKL